MLEKLRMIAACSYCVDEQCCEKKAKKDTYKGKTACHVGHTSTSLIITRKEWLVEFRVKIRNGEAEVPEIFVEAVP